MIQESLFFLYKMLFSFALQEKEKRQLKVSLIYILWLKMSQKFRIINKFPLISNEDLQISFSKSAKGSTLLTESPQTLFC